jgi:sugar lactone lactonase YvrE
MTLCTTVVDDGNPCGESQVWDVTTGRLYWTDTAGRFFSYDWRTRERAIVLRDFVVNGAALNEDGGFTFINGSGVWQWDGIGTPEPIVATCGADVLQLNDCAADPAGRLIAGSCFYTPDGTYPLGKLYAIDANGAVRVLDEGFHLANGLGWSPDSKTLYFADSIARTIYAYSYDASSGTVRDRRIFVQLDRSSGVPDGLTVDADGYIWSAEWYGGCVSRYDPDGTLERKIVVPAKQTSSLAFGGPELRDLFITSAATSEPTPVMPPGYDPVNGYFGGALFLVNCGIQGRPEYRCRVHRPQSPRS